MQRPWRSKVCLHVGQELVDDESALRQVDEMGAVVRIFARKRRSRGEKAGVPAHHHRDIDAFQRQIVEIGAGEGLRDEPRRRRIARRVIEADEIVVDRLGDMDGAKPMVGFLRFLGDDAHRVGGIVAADVEERVDRVRFQDLEDLLAIFAIRLVAGRAERGGRRRRDRLEVGDRLLARIDEIVVDDPAHALQRAIDMADVGNRRASSATPASDWLITAVGPPPWATRILCGMSSASLGRARFEDANSRRRSGFRRRSRHAQDAAAVADGSCFRGSSRPPA